MTAAKPLKYRGVLFRSTLEANWAATLDNLQIYWLYEPCTFPMPDGAAYVPDFYLPTLRTYCEAKGPGNERLWKPQKLAAQLSDNEFMPQEYQVVILRGRDENGYAVWEHVDPSRPSPVLAACGHCQHYGWAATDITVGDYCRRCFTPLDEYAERYYTASARGLSLGLYLPFERLARGYEQ